MALRKGDGVKIFLGLWIAAVIYSMFLVVPQYVGLGDAGRIIIVHVPVAWVTTAAFGSRLQCFCGSDDALFVVCGAPRS